MSQATKTAADFTSFKNEVANAMIGDGLFGRTIKHSDRLRAEGIVIAAAVMLSRGQSSIAHDVIMAGFALFEVSPGNLRMNTQELFNGLSM